MAIQSDTKLEQDVRRLQLEDGRKGGAGVTRDGIKSLDDRITELETVVNPPPDPIDPQPRQGIVNMTRNGDHNHSVNTWWETAPSANDKEKECANVYAYPPIAPIAITDAVMSSAVNPTELHSASNPFTAGMTGRYAIVAGAGAAGADLSGIMTYVSAGVVTLSNPCLTTVAGVAARINLQKFAHRNKKNSAASNPNDALKDLAHTQIATNIADPCWKKSNGTVQIGSTNLVGYPFGKFDNATGAVYAALNQLYPGREVFCRLNVARANKYVKVTGRLFLGIYNNNDLILDWVQGSAFSVSSSFEPPVPATTEASTKYLVVIETDQGFTLVSNQVTVLNGPDDAAIALGASISLAWTYFAGAVRTTVYRQRGAGNVFAMESFENGANSWTDVNLSTKIDTGTTVFPTFADGLTHVRSYWATAEGEFDHVLYDGEPGKFWTPIEAVLPFGPSVNMGQVFDPHFIIGLTEPLATELTDVVTNSTTAVTSAAAQFTAAMTGKAFTLTKADGTASVSGTFTYVSATNGTLSTAATWTEAGSTLVIADSQPNGLYFDLVGTSLTDGEWANNPEDQSELRGQAVASNPNGSSQGGLGGGDPTGDGGGGRVGCVLDESLIRVRGASNSDIYQKRADQVTLSDLLWNGLGFEDGDFNQIEWIKAHVVDELTWLLTETKRLGCTQSHRTVAEPETYKAGVGVKDLKRGRNVLISDSNSLRLEGVSATPREKGTFKVISFGLKKTKKRTRHLFVANDIVSHNLKPPPI